MSAKANQTHTIRLPIGAAAKIKAATGLPLSTIVRFMVMEMLAKYEADGRIGSAKAVIRSDVRQVVQATPLPPESTNDCS